MHAREVVFAVALAVVACTSAKDEDASGRAGAADAGSGGSVGSGGDAGSGTQIECDPLEPKAITLGKVVGVGKDAPGTLYVDAANGIFVSDAGKLLRQHVIGSGQQGSNEYNFSFVAPGADDSTARNLLVETTGDTASAMALGPNGKAFLDQPPPGTTMLTLVDPATLSTMAVVNTPNVIQYVADVANGFALVATRPMNQDGAASYGGLALFYGPKAAVAERSITALQQSLSGSGSLTFVVDGTPYTLGFGMVQGPDAGPFGTFTLFGLTPEGGATLGLKLRSPTPKTLPQDLTFTCSW